MADSLRDQLIAAGFEAPKKKPDNKARNKKRPAKASSNKGGAKKKRAHNNNKPANKNTKAQDQQSDEAIQQRKKLKAQIKELIDNNQLKEWKGEVTYRYLVDKRIRELYVTEPVHKQLAEREVAITRLNGDTYLVPIAIAIDIKKVNPQWSVFNTDKDTEDTTTGDEEYSEFQVPDDLQW